MQTKQSFSNKPAGFWLRLLAVLAENSLLFIITGYLVFNLSSSNSLKILFPGIVDALTLLLLIGLIRIVYTVLFTYYFGGNIGKLLTGIRVRRENGGALTLKQVIFRQLMSYRFSAMLLGLGFFSILKDEEKQGWHDKTIGSNVFAVTPLYPFAIAVLLGSLYINFYFLSNAYNNIKGGPLPAEVTSLVNSFKSQPKEEKKPNKPSESSASALLNNPSY